MSLGERKRRHDNEMPDFIQNPVPCVNLATRTSHRSTFSLMQDYVTFAEQWSLWPQVAGMEYG